IYGRYIHLDDAGKMSGPEMNFAFSGFVIAIRGVWCLMTAGHVLKKLETAAQHPKIKLFTCGFCDFFGFESKGNQPTPFAFDTEHIIPYGEESQPKCNSVRRGNLRGPTDA